MMHNIKIGFFLATRQILRASKWTTGLIIFVYDSGSLVLRRHARTVVDHIHHSALCCGLRAVVRHRCHMRQFAELWACLNHGFE